MPENPHVLVATLGGQPQVVTFTLDLLLQRGIPISEVVVVYPASYTRLQHSIACLNAEFPDDHYKPTGHLLHFRHHILTQYMTPIDDIIDEQTATGALNAMDELIRDLKHSGRTIHFSITGGRRLIGFLSFSAALLNFESTDCLWHIHTPEDVRQRVRDGAIMHVSPEDGVRLIEIPFARLAQPILTRILSPDPTNTRTIMDTQAARDAYEQRQRCRNVAERITPAQRRVLWAIAGGQHPQDVATSLGRSIDTISSHINVLLRECRNTWNIPERTRLDYRFLQMIFTDYVTNDG